MKKLLGTVSAVAFAAALGVGSALAAEEATGTIEQLDEELGTIVLDTGESFELAEGVSVEGLMEGDEVRVSYEEENGIMRATSVEPALELDEDPEEAVD